MTQADREPSDGAAPRRTYWQDNLRLLAVLLTIWFLVSFGFGILLRAPLDEVTFLGVPLGFWFAQQGSIYAFIAIVFAYVRWMRRIDRRHGVSDEPETGE